ncbi:hypothetical protein DPMN_131972 [Dreissena polymorpha]|uniref:Uncharacterized protein n=1 Tax=Dreissena polymorpha TaxID=45954 RepID=A0A9D4J9N6_DREPO|nr:hypothetical protein DPMN_131972 [Dreissena polymorpha]
MPPAWVYNGFISSLLARGFNMVAENVLNEMTNWPLAVSAYSSIKKKCLLLLLKWSGYLVCTPFYIPRDCAELWSQRLAITV